MGSGRGTRIGIYNLEPRVRNLALTKVAHYWRAKGATVELCGPVERNNFDVVYCSSIFDWTSKWYVAPDMVAGGTGFDLTTVLPPEIEAVEPHLNFGFTTRGCIRRCPFCVVPEKEGNIRIVSDLLGLWDGRAREVILYDNNILAVSDHFERVCQQAWGHDLKLDFNQGLDHRLLTPEIIDLMKRTRHYEYRFAFDHPSFLPLVDRAITMLQEHGIMHARWYVLVGFDTTLDEDLMRLNYLRERGQDAYVQRYRAKGKKPNRRLILLARWANQAHIFKGMDWVTFINHHDNRCYKELLYDTD